MLCAQAGVQRLAMEGNLAVLLLGEERRLSERLVRRLRAALPAEIRIWLALTEHDRIMVSLRNADPEQTFARLEPVLEAMAALPLEEEARRHQAREQLSARL
jgi:hypothetical protein